MKDDLHSQQATEIVRKIKTSLDNRLPCEVVELESRFIVSVKPLINYKLRSGDEQERAVITGVPVRVFGAGNIIISHPVKVGDKGWIVSSDRDLSTFREEFSQATPPTARTHSFSDGEFVPAVMSDLDISEDDEDSVVIQTLDRTVRIALDPSRIALTNGETSFVIDENSVKGVASGGFDFNGVTIDSNGVISATDAVVNGKSVDGHNHDGGSMTGYQGTPISGNTGDF